MSNMKIKKKMLDCFYFVTIGERLSNKKGDTKSIENIKYRTLTNLTKQSRILKKKIFLVCIFYDQMDFHEMYRDGLTFL